jgi:hypothetical protein
MYFFVHLSVSSKETIAFRKITAFREDEMEAHWTQILYY